MDFFDFLMNVDEHVQAMTAEHGAWVYVILFAIIFAETGFVVTPFLPGDTLLFAAGALAAVPTREGDPCLSIIILLPLFLAAAILGDAVNYWFGSKLGKRMVKAKRFRLIKPKHIRRTERFFIRYGGKTIVLARFIPVVRTFAPFVAGMGRMNYGRFLFFNVMGAIIWVVLCTGSGYLLGNVPAVQENFELAMLIMIVVTTLPIFIEYFRSRRRDKQEDAERAERILRRSSAPPEPVPVDVTPPPPP